MNHFQTTLLNVLDHGDLKGDRTGTGTISRFGAILRYSLLNDWLPLETTRKVAHKKIWEELEMFISGRTHVSFLTDRDNHIWDSWRGQDGTMGPMYGEQWRNWTQGLLKLEGDDRKRLELMLKKKRDDLEAEFGDYPLTAEMTVDVFNEFLAEKFKSYEQGGRGGIDQLARLVEDLKSDPNSRRMVISAWNPAIHPDTSMSPSANVDEGRMALAPCHTMWQVYSAEMTVIDIMRQHIIQNDITEDDRANSLKTALPEDAALLSMVRGYMLKKYTTIDPRLMGPGKEEEALSPDGMDVVRRWRMMGRPSRKLSLMLFARSQDLPLGTVFNIPAYAMMAKLLAKLTNMVPFEYIHVMGDHHIYMNQIEGVMQQLQRTPMKTPRAWLDDSIMNLEDFTADKVRVEYESHPAIKFPAAAV